MDRKSTEHDERPAAEPPVDDRPAEGDAAMTGATGSLTPRSGDEAFVPAELREIADPFHHRDMTVTQRREGATRHAGAGEPGTNEPSGRPRDDAPRDAGYGSEHGLRPDDPAYRHEAHPSASQAEDGLGDEQPSRPRPEGAGDGDEWSEEPEHF